MSRLPRFFSEQLPATPGEAIELAGEDAHHARNVLRLKPGAAVEVFDGKGGAGTFEVATAKQAVRVTLVRRTDEDREARARIVLAFAPPRPKRTLALVEKATELGVARFVPLATERTRVPLPERAIEKLGRRAIEACKQCGRNRVPEVAATQTLEELAREAAPLRLLPDTVGASPLKEVLRARDPLPASVLYAIGPEGGFSEAERALLVEAGFVSVKLGEAVLRVETAAIAVLTCLRYELG